MTTSPDPTAPALPSVLHRAALLELLLDTASEATGFERDEIIGPNRAGRWSDARHVIWYVLRDDHSWLLSEVASAFDRNHSTIAHGAEAARRRFYIGDLDTVYLVKALRAAARAALPLPDFIALTVQMRELTRQVLAMDAAVRQMHAAFAEAIDGLDHAGRAMLRDLDAQEAESVDTRNERA